MRLSARDVRGVDVKKLATDLDALVQVATMIEYDAIRLRDAAKSPQDLNMQEVADHLAGMEDAAADLVQQIQAARANLN
jgi:hypothetical protein